MRDTDYAFCVARLRAKESEMLSERDLEKLSSLNYDDSVEYLKDKRWIKEGGSVDDFLALKRKELSELITESVPNKEELKILWVLNDFFNIKAAVKCLSLKKNPEDYFIYPTTVKAEEIEKDYGSLVEKAMSYEIPDIFIDKAASEYALKYFKNNPLSVISEISALLCDSVNIKASLRSAKLKKGSDFLFSAIGECSKLKKELLVENALRGEKSLLAFLKATEYSGAAEAYEKGFFMLERYFEDEIMKIASKARFTAFSFSPVCLYYYKKLFEIKRVGEVLTSKLK